MDAPLEELPLHIVARERLRSSEVFTSHLDPPLAKFELPESCVKERITGEAIAVRNVSNLFEASFRAIALPDCDRAIERDHGGLAYGHQCVI
jgi:hypothetical protein